MSSPNPDPQPAPQSLAQSQYDEIGAKYSLFKSFPTERIETSNLLAAITPYVRGARVLDLASGTGHYSRKLATEWGAASVVGVDLSPTMVDVATAMTPPELLDSRRVRFRVGDALSLGRIDDEGFDLVIGPWLLNYAGTEDELAGMFEGIAVNLKNGKGVFVGIQAPAVRAAEMDEFAAKEYVLIPRRMVPPMRIGVRYYARNERMEGRDDAGWRVEVAAYDEKGEVSIQFRNYHLPVEVFERAAKSGGMEGVLEWKTVRMLEDVREEVIRDFGDEFWNQYFGEIGPHFGVLVVKKGIEEE